MKMPQPAPISDRDLVERLLKGDEEAFNYLWEVTYPRVLRFAMGIVDYDQDTAEDLTQEVFIHCLENLDQFEFKSKLSTWMMRIVYFKAIKHKQRESRKVSLTMDAEEGTNDIADRLPSTQANPRTIAAWKEAMAMYRRALATLSETERTIWMLRQEEGLPYEEIASIVENTPNALRIVVSRVKQRLVEEMGAEYLASLMASTG